MLEIMYEIPSRDDIKSIEITEDIVRGERNAFEEEKKVPASG
jgi:ATP-dependent protease Clp ATPase subunit